MQRLRILATIAIVILLAVTAGILWFSAPDGEAIAIADFPEPAAVAPTEEQPVEVEAVKPKSREEKRFARADRNDDGEIDRDEYLHARRRNFDKLDVDGDGKLSFEEYAHSGIEKFVGADKNRDGRLDAKEFATLAPKPAAQRPAAKPIAKPCVCEES